MRLGPSKSRFNTAGVQLDNYTPVTVETRSLNGWTLCFYEGTEGWIRTDFLFDSTDAIDRFLGISDSGQQNTEYACAGLYISHATGEYAGEPLNMRDGPARSYDLIKQVPDYGVVRITEATPVIDGWVFVEELDTDEPGWPVIASGYVLYKYLQDGDGIGDKPVLYLYPEKTADVDVCLKLADGVHFSCTYPAYRDGWRVTAEPDGMLTDRDTGKTYTCLYWELFGKADYRFDAGFVVKGSDTADFLEKTLTQIGLSARERNEFIVYWLPRMQNNAYNLISFQTEAYTSLAQLEIAPAPDSLLRVFMAYRPLNAPVEVPPQRFEAFVRTGFTAVEWGGAEVR